MRKIPSNEKVLITGCARSRTSLVASLFSKLGFWGGETFGPDRNNKAGYFENKLLREKISKPLLDLFGADRLGQSSFPDLSQVQKASKNYIFISELRRSWYKCMDKQGWDGSQSWYYKGAKLCLMWPIWNEVFPEAFWVIVRRNPEDIAESCLRTSFMRAYSKKADWLRWVNYHQDRFEAMKEAGLRVFEIWTDAFLDGDFQSFIELMDWLGMDEESYDLEEIKNLVQPSITHKLRRK